MTTDVVWVSDSVAGVQIGTVSSQMLQMTTAMSIRLHLYWIFHTHTDDPPFHILYGLLYSEQLLGQKTKQTSF